MASNSIITWSIIAHKYLVSNDYVLSGWSPGINLISGFEFFPKSLIHFTVGLNIFTTGINIGIKEIMNGYSLNTGLNYNW
jgi:hypothetical protein